MIDIQEIEAGRSYKITHDSTPEKVAVLDFVNSSQGGLLTNEVLLFVLIKRLETLDREVPCKENAQVIELLIQSMDLLIQRANKQTDADVESNDPPMVLFEKARASHEWDQQGGDQSAQLQRARDLLTRLHAVGDQTVKKMIEESTGSWMVWGADRTASLPQENKPC